MNYVMSDIFDYTNCITSELDKYDIKFINLFNELFPTTVKKYYVTLNRAEYNGICYTLKSRSIGATSGISGLGTKVYFSDPDDFWSRWNRFKKIEMFW